MTAAVDNADRAHASGFRRTIAAGCSALLIGGLLAACGMVSDDTAGALFVTPRRFEFFNCQLMAQTLVNTRARIDELRKLSARAAQEPAGQVIGAAAYRTEYLMARGDEKQLLAMLKEKNCQGESTWASERSVY